MASVAEGRARHPFLCVALWSDATATVGLHSSVMVVGSQLVGSAEILAHACAAQAGSWRELVDLISPHLGPHRRPQTEHPRRGPAPPRQMGLDLDARLAGPPRTDPEVLLACFDELSGALAEDVEGVISAARSERGITHEVEFPGPAGHSAPARVHTGLETEGPLGPALTIALELPCDPLDDLTANQLNVWEMCDRGIGFMLGGWRSGPGAPTLNFRVPLTAVFPAFADVLTTDTLFRALRHGHRLQRAAREPPTN